MQVSFKEKDWLGRIRTIFWICVKIQRVVRSLWREIPFGCLLVNLQQFGVVTRDKEKSNHANLAGQFPLLTSFSRRDSSGGSPTKACRCLAYHPSSCPRIITLARALAYQGSRYKDHHFGKRNWWETNTSASEAATSSRLWIVKCKIISPESWKLWSYGE
jgi:hypothetical protein